MRGAASCRQAKPMTFLHLELCLEYLLCAPPPNVNMSDQSRENSHPGQVVPARTGPDVGTQSGPLGPASRGPAAMEKGGGQSPAATDPCLSVVCVRVCPTACPLRLKNVCQQQRQPRRGPRAERQAPGRPQHHHHAADPHGRGPAQGPPEGR